MKRKYQTETIERKIPDESAEGFYTETVSIIYPDAGTKKSSFNGEWEICELCGYIAPRNELNDVDGKWYCSKYGCYDEIIDRYSKEM